MTSGQVRLLEAARSLLLEHPDREPSTRELYEAAGVAAPTLYHHFGTKTGLLQAVVGDAFEAYLARKRLVPRTGDLLVDFAAGWAMHVEFGVQNPVLYALMYGSQDQPPSQAAQVAEEELRRGLIRMQEAGLLRVSVDDALATTTAMAIGCVMQLIRTHRTVEDPLVDRMRVALVAQLAGPPSDPVDVDRSADAVLRRLAEVPDSFTPAEAALLRQWLHTLTSGDRTPRTQARPHDTKGPR